MTKKENLTLQIGSPLKLAQYVASQLDRLFPDTGTNDDVAILVEILSAVLERMRPILASVRSFEPDVFNHFNSMQYATFLYLVGNEHWRRNGNSTFSDRVFYLNKALNSIDIYCRIQMPEIFFISHGVGTVLGNATYGNRIVFFQNVTIGRVGDSRPTIGENVIVYSGATITGNAVIGNNSVISAGTFVHGANVPDNVLVFGYGSDIVFRPLKKKYQDLYLREI